MLVRNVAVTFALALSITGVAADAGASESRFGANDIPTLFGIAKNTNRNVVEYGIRLDAECKPIGNEPVYAYWHDYEQGPNVYADLNFIDRTVYSVSRQNVVRRDASGSRVIIVLKAASDRSIAVNISKRDGKCVSETNAFISGTAARLDRIFVQVSGTFSYDWIELRGFANGKPIVERVKK